MLEQIKLGLIMKWNELKNLTWEDIENNIMIIVSVIMLGWMTIDGLMTIGEKSTVDVFTFGDILSALFVIFVVYFIGYTTGVERSNNDRTI